MSAKNKPLIDALRDAAERLRSGAHYAWGHHGACNCGHLLQSLTRLDEKAILMAAQQGNGEWTEIAAEYCISTGLPVDAMLSALIAAGLSTTDIHHVEYLSDKAVLNYLPGGFRWLRRNQRQDVIDYFDAFARMLEVKQVENGSRKDPASAGQAAKGAKTPSNSPLRLCHLGAFA